MSKKRRTGVINPLTQEVIPVTADVVKALLDLVGHMLRGVTISQNSEEWQQRNLELIGEYRKAVEGEK